MNQNKLNILIPLAGNGKRFVEAGYPVPKPFIDIKGKPMIKRVVENLNIDGHYIFIIQRQHMARYNATEILNEISKNDCEIIVLDNVTEGAACTSLLAKNSINNNTPLIIANSDQIVEWKPKHFIKYAELLDGCILTFYAKESKWSYVKINSYELVTEVAEKVVISNKATVGIYYWNNGTDYVKYAEQMIANNIRTNNEFYICPVYNEAIKDNKRIGIYNINVMHGLGTPEDLERYENVLRQQ